MTTTMAEKILAKAEELEQQARALRLTAAVFDGVAHTQKRGMIERTLDGAISLRRAQQNGSAPTSAHTNGTRPISAHRQLQEQRAKKAHAVVSIVKAYGKPMPIKKLAEAARAQGVPSLTGMSAYVVAGYLRKRGKNYSFLQMPVTTEKTD